MPYLVKNWRPVSLLNCDYKIATKAVANRFKEVLPKLIENVQPSFLQRRFIGENIRLIDSVINFTTDKNIPGFLTFLEDRKRNSCFIVGIIDEQLIIFILNLFCFTLPAYISQENLAEFCF